MLQTTRKQCFQALEHIGIEKRETCWQIFHDHMASLTGVGRLKFLGDLQNWLS